MLTVVKKFRVGHTLAPCIVVLILLSIEVAMCDIGSETIRLRNGSQLDLIIVNQFNMTMVVPSNDQIIGPSIRKTGTFDVVEREAILELVQLGSVVVEVGANVGPYSVYIADKIGVEGRLFSFEPFKLLFQVLTTNVVLNGLSNVQTVNAGVGDWPIREIEADGPNFAVSDNYGASTLVDESRRTWIFGAPVRERVRVIPLDSFSFRVDRIDLLKIDAEGMEYDVLRGARSTVKRYRPVVYAENNTPDVESGFSFDEFMGEEFGYSCYRPTELERHNIVICRFD